MPPSWIPIAGLMLIIGMSALRLRTVKRHTGHDAYSFGRHAEIQGVAERIWRITVISALVLATIAWQVPHWEDVLGRADWASSAPVRWLSAVLFAVAVAIVAIAQTQMGTSWRVGVPEEGLGKLVTHGLFSWSRNPVFVGLLLALIALLLWSPTVMSAAVLAAGWTLTMMQVRIEEEALTAAHGDAYERCVAKVGRWFGRRHGGRIDEA
ncbi:MAG: hypothetical protein C0456_05440 [Hyphomonas sp.]|nr:hypothetical protein [Hyphomonas sp.]